MHIPLTHAHSSTHCNVESREVVTTGHIPQQMLDAERAALDARSFEFDSDPEDDS